MACLLVGALGIVVDCGPASAAVAAKTFTVTTAADTNDGSCSASNCTLREAIVAANGSAGHDVIAFAIAGSNRTISPTGALPTVTDPVTISGNTQSGWVAATPTTAATLRVALSGASAGPASGLTIEADDTVVRGLAVTDFSESGILVHGASGVVIAGNHLGVTAAGAKAANDVGVTMDDSTASRVGGTDPADRNVLSGNALYGAIVDGTSTGISFQGNYVGTNTTGTAAVANQTGIWIESSSNSVGGTGNGAGNVISGNAQHGVLVDAPAGSPLTGNVIAGNRIGTNATGTAKVANGWTGVSLLGTHNTVVGGTASGAANVISGNGSGVNPESNAGIRIDQGRNAPTAPSSQNQVQGNLIGTDAIGTKALANGTGVYLDHSTDDVIGGAQAGAGNTISGNATDGLRIGRTTTSPYVGTSIEGNRIGTTPNGTQKVPNGDAGIVVSDPASVHIGGTAAGAGNVISNNVSGIEVDGWDRGSPVDGPGLSIEGNHIGTDPTATLDLGNSYGIRIIGDSQRVIVGASVAADDPRLAGNTIAYNDQGISLERTSTTGWFPATMRGNSLHDNYPNGQITFARTGDRRFAVVDTAKSTGAEVTITGHLTGAANTGLTVDLYAGVPYDAGAIKVTQPRTYLGTATAATDVHGNATFAATIAATVDPDAEASALPTDPDGASWGPSAGRTFEYEPVGGNGATLPAPSPGDIGSFGTSVATSDDGLTVVVGASTSSDPLVGAGDAWVYTRASNSAPFGSPMRLSHAAVEDQGFGNRVAISGDGNVILVSSTDAAGESVALAYTRVSSTSWSVPTTVATSPSTSGGEAGYLSLALDDTGASAVIGDPSALIGGEPKGEVHVLRRSGSTWTALTTLTLGGTVDVHYRGSAIDLSSNGLTLAFTSSDGTHVATRSVASAAFTKWPTLLAAPADEAVALSADGRTLANGNGDRLLIYRLSGTTWVFEKQFIAPPSPALGAGTSDYAETAIAMSAHGTRVAVSDWSYATTGSQDGRVYVYDRVGSTWHQSVPTDPTEEEGRFGFGLAMTSDGTSLIAGAPTEDVGGTPAGAVHVFGLPSAPLLDAPWKPFSSWTALVNRLYSDLLGHAPTAAQLDSWVSKLQAGSAVPGDIVASLRASAESTEMVDPVVRLYRAYFLRIPDASGLTYWVGRHRSGKTLTAISDTMAASSEFRRRYGDLSNRAYVETVYLNVLGRAGDAGGIAYWTKQLDAKKKSRGQVMVGFSESSEYIRKQSSAVHATVLYVFLLRRTPSALEFEVAIERLNDGTTVATLAGDVITGTEYAGLVAP